MISTLSQKCSVNKQFSGSEVLQNHTTANNYAARNSSLTKEESIKYLHYLFCDGAIIFYQKEIEENFYALDGALRRIEGELYPRSGHQQIYKELRDLSFNTFLENCS